jgi:predicted CoA-binding protein
MPSIAIIGASSKREKFGNKAVRAYLAQGWTVYPINPREAEIEGQTAYASLSDVPAPLDRVALYLPPELGLTVLDELSRVEHQDLILNPGTENAALLARAAELGLPARQDCAIVDIGMSPADF